MNRKYSFLDNHEWLKEKLMIKTVMQLAGELAEATGHDKQKLHGCITFRINRWFTEEEKKAVKRGRRTNRKGNKTTDEITVR